MIKFVKDETVTSNFDIYKSHTVHVPSGEPPGSLSRPPAKRKPGVVRPITQGKLLKAGAPDVGHSLLHRSFDSKKKIYRRSHKRHQDRNLHHNLFREGLPIDNLQLYHRLLGMTRHLRVPLRVLMCHHPRQSNLKYQHTELNLHLKDKKERCR